MSYFRETKACLAYPTRNQFINKQEFALLYDVHMLTCPKFPYWNYERFDQARKRFYNEGIYKFAGQMQLPDEVAFYYGLVGASVPALCLYLKCYDCPCRYGNLFVFLLLFCKRPIPELSILTDHMMEMIYSRLHHLLSIYNHNLLSPKKLLQKDPNYGEKTSKTNLTSCCFKTLANCCH